MMNPVPASVGAASLPQVNLLPAEVGQRRARGRARLAVMAVAGLLLLAIGGVVFLAYSQKSAAQTEVDDLALRNTELQAEQANLRYVTLARERKDLALEARSYAGLYEIQIAQVLQDVRRTLPEHAFLWTLAWSGSTINGPAALESSPFAVDDLGYLTMTFRTDYVADTANLVAAIDSIPGLARTEVTTVAFIESADPEPKDDAYSLAWKAEREERGITDPEVPAGTELIPGKDAYFELVLTTRIDIDALSTRFSEHWYADIEPAELARIDVLQQAVDANREFRDAVIARARDVGAPTSAAPGDAVSPTPAPEETN